MSLLSSEAFGTPSNAISPASLAQDILLPSQRPDMWCGMAGPHCREVCCRRRRSAHKWRTTGGWNHKMWEQASGGRLASSRYAAPSLRSGPSGDPTQPPDTSGIRGRKRASGHKWSDLREHVVPGSQPPYLVFAIYPRFCAAINRGVAISVIRCAIIRDRPSGLALRAL